MKDSLVAINIINDKEILNVNGVPLLFYWDGQSNVIESICNDENFKKYLYNVVNNKNVYSTSKIVFFYFKYDNETNLEKYADDNILIQNFLHLKDFPEGKINFCIEYLWDHFLLLYKSAYGVDYDKEVNLLSVEDHILDIYDKMKEKYPKRVIKSTVINYIRSELMKTDNLNMENTDWIIDKLETLLNERE